MNDRDHGQRSNGIRLSIDGFAAALSPRKRHSFAPPSANPQPLEPDPPPPPDQVLPDSAKHPKGIMSFFSRFGSKGRSPLHISTKKHSKDSGPDSVPATPVTPSSATTIKHSHSTSALTAADDLYEQRPAETFPLCVAYIQAIKCANLPACTLSSETILKRISDKEKLSKEKRSRVLQRTHVSTKSTDLEWTRKMFVLAPGFLLQYSGNGTEDRLPEKILQLTASTLAFASDIIPGRPWVLLVYRSATGEDGMLVQERRATFLAKVAFRGPSRGGTAAMIMVFESAEEMDCWMGMIRGEAVRLGGGSGSSGLPSYLVREVDSSEGSQRSEGTTKQLYGQDSEDTRRASNGQGDLAKNEGSSSDENSKRTSAYYRSSTDDAAHSVTTAVSGDQVVLDQLRSSSRLSHRSKARVSTVSPDTSPDRSSIATNTKDRRRSTALSVRSRSSVELRASQRPLSAIDKDGNIYSWLPRTPSPGALNFSLPLSTTVTQSGKRRPLSTSVVPPLPNSLSPSFAAHSSPSTTSATSESSSRPRSQPTVNSKGSGGASRPKQSPTSKRRPVSMVDPSPRSYSYGHAISSTPIKRPNLPPPINIPGRNRSLRRRSLTTLSVPSEESPATAGPAPHPPPSIPLPELPPDAGEEKPSSGFVRHPSGTSNGRRNRRGSNDRPRLGKRQSFQSAPNEELLSRSLPSSEFSTWQAKEMMPQNTTATEDRPSSRPASSRRISSQAPRSVMQRYMDGE